MIFNKLLASIDNGESVDILTILDSAAQSNIQAGQMVLIHKDGKIDGALDADVMQNVLHSIRTNEWLKPVTLRSEGRCGETFRVFWDKIVKPFRAIVLGGGHISQPLAQLLSLLDFEVTVMDDRPEFANPFRFPSAQNVICERFHQALQQLEIDENTAVIIVTRGHQYDMDCLRATMVSNARYLGMIGSRRRIREIKHLLREEGAPEDLEGRLRAPIGLDTKAETPAEIAVSIAAEVVAVFRDGSGRPLSGCREVS